MTSKLKFHKTLYHWTEQLAPDQIQNCMRSLQENHCGDVHQVGLRVRYVRPDDCQHFVAGVGLHGGIIHREMRRTYAEVVEAIAEFVGNGSPDDREIVRRLLQEEVCNHVHPVSPALARADYLVITQCSCDDPDVHVWLQCRGCGREIARTKKPDILVLMEESAESNGANTVRMRTRMSSASSDMVNEFLAYYWSQLISPKQEPDMCAFCCNLESAIEASPKNERSKAGAL